MSEEAAALLAERPPARALAAFEAFGLELEYMLVDRDSLDVRPIAELAFESDGAPPGSGELARGALGWSNELVSHVVELKNVAPLPLAGLPAALQAEAARFDRTLYAHGARLMPGGMHPWMNPATETMLWRHGNAAVYGAYDRIFGCRAHGWANLQSTHINLPFANDAEFERLHAAVRIVLPLIPALAASSPYADGRASGMLDFRMEAYRHNAAAIPSITGAVVPEPIASRAEYEQKILQPMYRAIAPHDRDGILRQEWLNSRGAIARFSRNAIEIRVMDVQECPAADVALAAIVTDVVRALYEERFAPLARQQRMPTAALARILRGCMGDGDRACIAQPEYLSLFGIPRVSCKAGELWRRIADRIVARAAHGSLWASTLDVVLTRGPLARRLLDAAGAAPTRSALAATYRRLCDCLADGRLFEP